MKLFLLFGLAAIFILSGCKDSEKKTPVRGETFRELTEADLKNVITFAEKFAQDVREGRANRVSSAFNTRGYFRVVFDGIELSPSQYEQLVQEMLRGHDQKPGGIGWSLLNQSLIFVKLLDFKGMKMPLFRLEKGDSGFSYIILKVLPDSSSGEIEAYDVYDVIQSSWSTEVTRYLILPEIKRLLGSEFDQTFNKKSDDDFLNQAATVEALNSAFLRGDSAGSQSAYRALPEKLQKKRYFWTLYLSSLIENPNAHAREAQKYDAAFPDDAGAALLMLELEISRKAWDKVHRHIETIREFVDGDHYLDYNDSRLYVLAEDYEPGLKSANKALEGNTENEDYWWNAFTCLLQLEKYQEFADRLNGYEKQFGKRLTQDDFAHGALGKFKITPPGRTYFAR